MLRDVEKAVHGLKQSFIRAKKCILACNKHFDDSKTEKHKFENIIKIKNDYQTLGNNIKKLKNTINETINAKLVVTTLLKKCFICFLSGKLS